MCGLDIERNRENKHEGKKETAAYGSCEIWCSTPSSTSCRFQPGCIFLTTAKCIPHYANQDISVAGMHCASQLVRDPVRSSGGRVPRRPACTPFPVHSNRCTYTHSVSTPLNSILHCTSTTLCVCESKTTIRISECVNTSTKILSYISKKIYG